ncbi:hypothetical protein DPMN_007245 [Dreissena polymorpha]|uniref:Uncharacterized protein n=1 Tax=Dreissena polymorpha TaxID=45954 RepID=A0A9D4RVU9_DREPO|nr:hypothetical protein DPMN_007245 [Dreissena polymorpha]
MMIIFRTNLDCDAKRWRLFADIINDMAIFLEIMAPNFPMVFTFILCTSGVLKSIVGVSGGATRAALTQHQARRNNMADVSAKDGSQETLVNLAALLCSLLLVPIVTGRHMLIWTLYIVFTCLHLFANFTAVKGVIMETLNQARLHILLQEYFSTGIVLPPNVVNRREPVLWSTRRKLKIHLGVSLVKMSAQSFNMEAVIDILKVKKYVLWFDRKDSINISLSVTSDFMDQLRSCYHAELLNYMAEGKTVMLPKNIYYGSDASYQEILTGEEGSCSFVEDTFSQFIQDLHSHGWQTDVCLLGSDEWRTNIHPHTDTLHTKNL